jgi:hypothetical protein
MARRADELPREPLLCSAVDLSVSGGNATPKGNWAGQGGVDLGNLAWQVLLSLGQKYDNQLVCIFADRG